jgi:aminotransferase
MMPPRSYLSRSTTDLRPSGIRKYFEIVATMPDVVTLGIGEPDFVTPGHIMEAGIQSLQAGHTGYTSNAGLIELRRSINRYLLRLYNVEYNPDTEMVVTIGASEAMFVALRAILDPGDEVLVVEPCFVAYAAAVSIAGGVPVPVSTRVEDSFQVTGAQLEAAITPRTKAIFIGYPNNPTGAVLSYEHMLEVAAVAAKYDLVVISDEIYDRLVYGQPHINFASLPGMFERTILLGGMSKAYAMTGWRIGYVCAPAPLMEGIKKLHQYLIMSAPTVGQYAAIEALEHGEPDVQAMCAEYDARRKLIVSGFNSLGLTCFEPLGAFYAFPNIQVTGMDDTAFCDTLLYEGRVAMIPGSAFGDCGAGHARASYATSMDNIHAALERLTRFMQRYG